jgi:HEPN domain-containing protein
LTDELKKLDRFYIPTRYPNGVPEGTPRENYTAGDSEFALRIARMVYAKAANAPAAKGPDSLTTG